MLGERLTALRKEWNLTQESLAEVLHITRSTLAQYEIDRRIPEYLTLERLANFFDVSIDYLVGRVDLRNWRVEEALLNRSIDFSDENAFASFSIYYNGTALTEDEKMELLAICRGILLAKQALK